MKKLLTLALIATSLFTLNASAQHDHGARKSPAATVSQKLTNGGATIKINYSQPSLNGRKVGVSVEPMKGQIWRTGANEATVFETDKPVNIMGQTIPAGKYSLFTIFNDQTVTVILNKKWDQWGADGHDPALDQARFETKVRESEKETEKMTFTISPEGTVSLMWGNKIVEFYIF